MKIRRNYSLFACSLVFLLVNGCGGGEQTSAPQGESQGESQTAQSETKVPPTVSITTAKQEKAPVKTAEVQPEFPKGSPEWYLLEIEAVRLRPYPKSDDLEQLQKVRRTRNLEIIDNANKCIGVAHKDPAKVEEFTVAVRHLLQARLQLALQGNREDVDLLYEDAQSIYERDEKSTAAGEALYTLASFAHTNAKRYARKDARWLQEFVNQARLFATKFPQDVERAAPLLYAAGWSCELNKQPAQAITCYETLEKNFPNHEKTAEAVAVMRRMKLKGTVPEFAGPTIDGGFVNIEEYKGKPVLIVFWSSDTSQFVREVPELQKIIAQYQPAGLKVIGVNLDAEELDVDRFQEKTPLPWPQIFFSERSKRRWENSIVKYYGIREIPTYWLIDPQGIVVDTELSVKTLPDALKATISKP